MLDLSLQWRFANLPNNAKLEMVPISRSREGPENMVGSSAAAPPSSSVQTTGAEQMGGVGGLRMRGTRPHPRVRLASLGQATATFLFPKLMIGNETFHSLC